MEIRSQQDQANYDRAVREAEKEAWQRAEGTWRSAAKMKAWKRDSLSIIKKQANREFAAMQDYLAGKIDEPKTTRMMGGKLYGETLYYFESPETFDADVAALDNDLGDLPTADLVWIRNMRALIQGCHARAYGQREAGEGAA